MNMKHSAALVVIIAYACFAAAGEDTAPKPTPEPGKKWSACIATCKQNGPRSVPASLPCRTSFLR